MNPFRAQPPVYSPLPLGAIGSGLAAWALGAGAAREHVEAELRRTYAPHGLLLTDTGTTALRLALELAVRERPGPVALPAYCCYDIATAADGASVEFALYDVDPATLGPDFDSLRRVLVAGARTVVAAHLWGVPVDLPAVVGLAREFGAVVIEDAAQGAGTRIAGRPAGALGRYGVLSFGRGKGVTAGRGGALLVNDVDAAAGVPDAAARLGPSRAAPRDALALLALWLLVRPSIFGLPLALPFLRLGETVYRSPTPPAPMSALALGVLGRTLDPAMAETSARRRNAQWLVNRIGANGRLRVPVGAAGAEPGYLRMPVVPPAPAGQSGSGAPRRIGIWPGYPKSLADLEGFGSRRSDAGEALVGARELASRLVTLPTHGWLRPADLASLGAWLAHPA